MCTQAGCSHDARTAPTFGTPPQARACTALSTKTDRGAAQTNPPRPRTARRRQWVGRWCVSRVVQRGGSVTRRRKYCRGCGIEKPALPYAGKTTCRACFKRALRRKRGIKPRRLRPLRVRLAEQRRRIQAHTKRIATRALYTIFAAEYKTERAAKKAAAVRRRYWRQPEVERQRVQVYKLAHPHIAHRSHGRGRERWQRAAAQTDGTLTARVVRSLLASATTCRYCGRAFTRRVRKTVDHKTPLSAGGTHGRKNVVVCCARCNRGKGRHRLTAWLNTQPGMHTQTVTPARRRTRTVTRRPVGRKKKGST